MAGPTASGGGGGGDPGLLSAEAWPLRLSVLVSFWTLVGLGTGLQQWLALGRPTLPDWVDFTLHQWLSAAPWLLATPAIAWVATAAPPDRDRWKRWLLLHGAAAAATALGVNLVMAVLYRVTGSPLGSPAGVLEAAVAGAVRWGHVVAVVYALIVALVLLAERRAAPEAGSRPAHSAIMLRQGSGSLRLEPSEIDWLEADGDYVRVHAGDTEHLVTHRLGELADALAQEDFVRIHRSSVVNAARVRSVRPVGRGDREVVLRDGTTLRMSRRRARALDAYVGRDA